ncbi:hypothetical protein [Eilatimonas milleporae]|uniref:Uncharacterized protein n=1 Tax=Eilatimonas milleporae TaxID=911205 RepID=A0A3M0CE44_9PROT|nr:hypothetical protein [Eilatimonas milleporae]RMB08091.1 hypothetical protein BXY39_2187 [Eilatimonas milleporae]
MTSVVTRGHAGGLLAGLKTWWTGRRTRPSSPACRTAAAGQPAALPVATGPFVVRPEIQAPCDFEPVRKVELVFEQFIGCYLNLRLLRGNRRWVPIQLDECEDKIETLIAFANALSAGRSVLYGVDGNSNPSGVEVTFDKTRENCRIGAYAKCFEWDEEAECYYRDNFIYVWTDAPRFVRSVRQSVETLLADTRLIPSFVGAFSGDFDADELACQKADELAPVEWARRFPGGPAWDALPYGDQRGFEELVYAEIRTPLPWEEEERARLRALCDWTR